MTDSSQNTETMKQQRETIASEADRAIAELYQRAEDGQDWAADALHELGLPFEPHEAGHLTECTLGTFALADPAHTGVSRLN
jgi:hypothetical protein